MTGSSSKIIYTAPQKGDAKHTLADIRKAKKELGWEPKVSIGEGLKKYLMSCGDM